MAALEGGVGCGEGRPERQREELEPVFNHKIGKDAKIEKHIARLVAQGFGQV